MPLQVFLAASSKDYELAQQVYDFLTGHHIEVFFSRESLPRLGSSDYRKHIDDALDRAIHMVVVTSSAENVRSRWLEAEWGMFVNEMRSGRKEGNLVTVIAAPMTSDKLPLSLRNYQVIPFGQMEQVLHYVGGSASARFQVADLHLPDEPLLGFVEVPGGPFLMGSDKTKDQAARGNEMPQHTVDVPTFYLARYPVTVAQFRALRTGAKPGEAWLVESRHPVVHVSWKNSLEYCSRLDRALRGSDAIPHTLKGLFENGFRLSLPSEAEWEKAARGTDGRIYPWGDSIDPSRANFDATKPVTTTVDAFPKGVSPYGIFDMSGNVHEWTRINLKSYPYDSDDDRERPDDNCLRVLRGGSFKDNANSLRAAYRDAEPIGYRCNYIGFRVVCSRLRP